MLEIQPASAVQPAGLDQNARPHTLAGRPFFGIIAANELYATTAVLGTPGDLPKMPSDDLAFLQTLKEAELCELVLVPLLEQMNYFDIRYTHGLLEHGKDLIFSSRDPLEGVRHLCATVKQRPLNGSVSDSKSIHEVYFQIRQALTQPFVDPLDGQTRVIDRVFVTTPFEISQLAATSIKGELRQLDNRVYFIDGPRLVSLIREHAPELLASLSNPDSRYLYTLRRRFSENRALLQLGASGRLSFLDLYIDPRLSPITLEDARYIAFSYPRLLADAVSPKDFLANRPFVVILGDVGAGKTTLLHKLALELSESGDGSGRLPLFVSLAALPRSALRSHEAFSAGLLEHLSQQHFQSTERRIEEHPLFLDGFDELAGDYEAVTGYIDLLARDWPGGILLTSRPSRAPRLGAPFEYAQVQPFGETEMRRFLSKWFSHDEDLALRVYDRINRNTVVRQFCATPLVLTLYAILASRVAIDDLPSRRTDIYAAITRLLLGEWDRLRNVVNHYSPELKGQVLEDLAFECHKRNEKRFPLPRLTSTIVRAVESRRLRGGDAEAVSSEIVFRCSLIREGNGGWEFAHLSFQEFFCAQRLVREPDVKQISNCLGEEWWRGTLAFYFGLTRSLDSVRILPRWRKAHGMGFVLMEYLSEADYTHAPMRRTILEALGSDFLSATPVNDKDLEICRRVGDEITDSLEALVNARDLLSGTAVLNFVRIMLAIDTREARRRMLRASHLCKYLDFEEASRLAELTFPYIGEANGYKFVSETIGELKRLVMRGASFRSLEGWRNIGNRVGYLSDLLANASRTSQLRETQRQHLEDLLREAKAPLDGRLR